MNWQKVAVVVQGLWRYLILLTEIGLTIAVSVTIGYVVGDYLDRLLRVSMVFTFVGSFLGVVAGFYNVYKFISRVMDNTKR